MKIINVSISVLYLAAMCFQARGQHSIEALNGKIDSARILTATQPSAAEDIGRNVLATAKAIDAEMLEVDALLTLAWALNYQHSFDECMQFAKRADSLSRKLEYQWGLMEAYSIKGNTYLFQGYNFSATSELFQALEIAKEIDSKPDVVEITRRIANAITQSNDFAKSLQLLKEILPMSQDLGLDVAYADILNSIGGNYHDLGLLDSSLHIDLMALAEMERLNDAFGKAMVLTNLAYTQLDLGLLQNAHDTLQVARAIVDTIEAPMIEANYLMLMAYYYFKSDDLHTADEFARQSLEVVDRFEYALESVWIYDLLHKIHKKDGSFEKALDYKTRATEIQDTLVYQSSNRQSIDLLEKYNSSQKDAALTQQQLKISQQINTRNVLLGTLVLFGLLGTFIIARFRLRQKITSQNLSLQIEKNQNLQQRQKLIAIDYMVQGQEEERKRIAKDLHDGLGSLLLSAKLQLSHIHNEIKILENLDIFRKAENLISNAHEEVRRIAHNMMPEALMNFGLKEAVQDLGHQINVAHEVQVVTSFHADTIHLNEPEEVHLFRIIQECLNNAIKHAGANMIEIHFHDAGENYLLEIKDDGQGFNPQELKDSSGVGLKNIEARVNYLNGKLDLQSAAGEGTIINILIPK